MSASEHRRDRPRPGRGAHEAGDRRRSTRSTRGRSATARRRRAHLPGRGLVVVADLAAPPDLRRPRRGLARLGHRRQRVRRLPQRLRRHGHGPRASEDRRGRARAAWSSSARTSPSRPRTRCRSPSSSPSARALPYWRFGNSGTEATLDAVRIMRASTGRDLIVKIEGTYHGHHDALMVSVFPPRGQGGAARPSELGAADPGPDPGHARVGGQRAVQRRSTRPSACSPSTAGEIAGMIVEPVMTNCGVVLPDDGYLAGPEGDLPHERRVVRLRRGEDRVHGRMGRRRSRRSASSPTSCAFAKAIGAGLPCGAIGGTEEAMAA